MKAVILAAGLGSRLRPITNEVPKCMVPVNGERIIDKQINNLHVNGIRDIIVVTGYKSNVLSEHLKNNYPSITIIENKEYDQTNNMYSLYLCFPYLGEADFLLMNADVFFDSDIIDGILSCEKENVIACEYGRYMEESMKITVNNDGRIEHISKKILPEEAYAVSIDVYRIGKTGHLALSSKVRHIIDFLHDLNSWTEVALDEIFSDVEFYPYNIKGRWFEIDNHKDLKEAEKIFK